MAADMRAFDILCSESASITWARRRNGKDRSDVLGQRAIIIGGGIGGLCTAIALRQTGIDAIVYEQAEELAAAGAGLTLWANAIKALRKLGLADAVIKSGSKIRRAEIRTAGGRTLSRSESGELEQMFRDPTIAIHRADLHNILLSALPADAVRLNAQCVRVDERGDLAAVHFFDGRRDEADIVIGADGIHSIIRRQLFPGVQLRYSGYTAWRGVVATKDQSALGLTSESWGRGSRFGILRIDPERVYWFATANTPAGMKLTGPAGKADLQKRFAGWHHPIGLLIDSTPAETILQTDIYDFPPAKRWSSGRVVLLGDAIHPTTPNMGQGACMAIESSVVLARCLSEEPDITAAFNGYEALRMPRTAWITEQSWKIGRVGQLQNPLACAVRDLLVRVTPPARMKKMLEKAAGYEV
jgi:2-polyprenyl-6-methoxyphenol hydroxylase-like FAD-dependent oxidoreductase